jgi:hypothetical protein
MKSEIHWKRGIDSQTIRNGETMTESIATIIQMGHLAGDPSYDTAVRVVQFINDAKEESERKRLALESRRDVIQESLQERE